MSNIKKLITRLRIRRAIQEFVKKGKYDITDTEDCAVLDKSRQFACDLVANLKTKGLIK